MSELRHDPIQRRWVIIATERSRRPTDFQASPEMSADRDPCPFCEGNEESTPPEITATRRDGSAPDTPGWAVRVVPNKFPALMIEGELERKRVGIYERLRGVGAHEVIVETTQHDQAIPDMPRDQVRTILHTYQERLRNLHEDPRLKYVLIFKNHGVVAGASLSHAHTQVIATPVTPPTVARELESARDHRQRKGSCLFCDLIGQELEEDLRIVYADDHFVALCPYASRFPFEVLLAPRKHSHTFTELSGEGRAGLASALREVLARLKVTLDDPPYNFMFHTAPNVETSSRRSGRWASLPTDYHWHIEILPRLTRVAGFEWGTGFHINAIAPDDAARFLREASLPPFPD